MKLFLCLLTLLAPLAAELPTDLSQKAKPATVKVLLTKLADEAILEVKGKYRVYSPKTELLIGSGSNKWDRLLYSGSGIKWGSELFPGSFEMRIVPSTEQTTLHVNGAPYKGVIEVYAIAGTINIVNEVDVENYLKASLSTKCPPGASQEALEALSIVERTNLYYLASKAGYASWQIKADDNLNFSPEKQNPLIQAAVDRTRGYVLTYHDQLFPASWSKNSAGRTVSYSSIYRKGLEAPPGVQELPSVSEREESKWSTSIPKQTLAELAGLDTLLTVELFQAENSNKVYAIRLSDGITSKDMDFFRFQEAIGPNLIRSNDFNVKVEEESVAITGFGEGAGVGLCLNCAETMVKQSEDSRKILFTHFPGSSLVKMQGLEPVASIWK